MKKFILFEHPDGRKEAVKAGFSWPGFFFSGIWLIVKKLWTVAIIWWVLAFIPVLGTIGCVMITFVCGFTGNDMLRKNFPKRGFEKKATFEANNPDDALAKYYKENQPS